MVRINIDMPMSCWICGMWKFVGVDTPVCIVNNTSLGFNPLLKKDEKNFYCSLIEDSHDKALSKLKLEFEKANKTDDRFAAMEEAEEFMDGEMIYNSGIARGKYLGLRKALQIVEEGDA